MIATRLRLRDFRSYASADVALGAGLTVVHGRNGAGKTNLLEALYFGCTGRSCRTSNEREVVRFDAGVARVEVDLRDDEGAEHTLTVGFAPGEAKRLQADGVTVERIDVQSRPLICVFLPDRLELVKGPPALRRSHVDQVVAAMWPGRSATRRAYGQALAQRNALLARVRGGRGSAELAAGVGRRAGAPRHRAARRPRRRDRAAVRRASRRSPPRSASAARPSCATGRARGPLDAAGLAAELAEHTASDLERGFTGHGPHRDDLGLLRGGRELRAYGSQGEQRLALLALLLAEREALAATRRAVPLMLLDDVMSELDPERRELLAQMLGGEGQSVITTTDLDARARAPTGPRSCASRSPTGPSCRTRWRHEPPRASPAGPRARRAHRAPRAGDAARRRAARVGAGGRPGDRSRGRAGVRARRDGDARSARRRCGWRRSTSWGRSSSRSSTRCSAAERVTGVRCVATTGRRGPPQGRS